MSVPLYTFCTTPLPFVQKKRQRQGLSTALYQCGMERYALPRAFSGRSERLNMSHTFIKYIVCSTEVSVCTVRGEAQLTAASPRFSLMNLYRNCVN